VHCAQINISIKVGTLVVVLLLFAVVGGAFHFVFCVSVVAIVCFCCLCL